MIAAMVTACSAQAQVSQEPACGAEHRGNELVTRIVFPDGYTVEGPWRITGVASAGREASVTAVLEHIVETSRSSDTSQTTALPGAIRVTFRGRTMNDLLGVAARVWCSTVLHTRPGAPTSTFEPLPPARMM
jgi:hypothetical protein